eukprot:SAG11_NODE_33064_length_279_cov_0.850000_1_plen_35_part_10
MRAVSLAAVWLPATVAGSPGGTQGGTPAVWPIEDG